MLSEQCVEIRAVLAGQFGCFAHVPLTSLKNIGEIAPI
jgi:hypothetical protein